VERKYVKKICTMEEETMNYMLRIEKRCRWGDDCQVWQCVFLHVLGDGNHWGEVEKIRQDRKSREEEIESRKEDEARERDEEVVKRRSREAVRKGKTDRAKEEIRKINDEKIKLLKARTKMEESTGLDHELDGGRKDMKKFANRFRKIKSIRKREEKKIEDVRTERRKDERGLKGSGMILPEEKPEERKERKKRQKKVEEEAKQKKTKDEEERKEGNRQREARKAAGSDTRWELEEMPGRFEKEVRRHKDRKEASCRKLSRGEVMRPELRRMHTQLIDESKKGIAYNQMKKAEAEDKLKKYKEKMKKVRMKRLARANLQGNTEEVLRLVGEMAEEEEMNEDEAIRYWDDWEEEFRGEGTAAVVWSEHGQDGEQQVESEGQWRRNVRTVDGTE
jgi:hypothetical protein